MVFYGGSVIGLFLEHRIKDLRFQKVASDYWIFITAYLVLVLIFTDITNLNFPLTLICSCLVLLILLLGVYKPLANLLGGIINTFRLILIMVRIAILFVGVLASKLVKFIRKLISRIKELYERYIIDPARRLYQAIRTFLLRVEKRLEKELEDEKLPSGDKKTSGDTAKITQEIPIVEKSWEEWDAGYRRASRIRRKGKENTR